MSDETTVRSCWHLLLRFLFFFFCSSYELAAVYYNWKKEKNAKHKRTYTCILFTLAIDFNRIYKIQFNSPHSFSSSSWHLCLNNNHLLPTYIHYLPARPCLSFSIDLSPLFLLTLVSRCWMCCVRGKGSSRQEQNESFIFFVYIFIVRRLLLTSHCYIVRVLTTTQKQKLGLTITSTSQCSGRRLLKLAN